MRTRLRRLSTDPDSQVISGGTDVLIRVREGKDAGKGLVSIHKIPELKGIEMEEDGDDRDKTRNLIFPYHKPCADQEASEHAG